MTGAEQTLPIVAVGASAGGLPALRRLLGAVEEKTGAAWIVVQHLDPTHETRLPELLGRATGMPVAEGADGTRLKADHVYVAPPGMDIGIDGDRLTVTEPTEPRFHRSPIDHLLTGLAEARGADAIGVILSGTGTDGAQGCRDIKSAGGAVLNQQPEDAEFDGMPQAAVASGPVDAMDKADRLAGHVLALLRQHATETVPPEEPDTSTLAEIVDLLADRENYNFEEYKPGTLGRRIRRRMRITGCADLGVYRDRLAEDPDERQALVRDLLIGVTRFFRDPEAWETFETRAVDAVIERARDGDALRAWVAGCATGEEAYTMAIVILERIEASGKAIDPLIFATDLNGDAIEAARIGRYPAASVAEMSPERIDRWFRREGDHVKVRDMLRDRLIFAEQNAISDPPFSSLDIISCRNLMIYLGVEAQRRVMETFHFALREDGLLFLGLSETIERTRHLFRPVDQRQRIYSRLPTDPARRGKAAGRGGGRGILLREEAGTRPALTQRQDAAVQAMLARYAPPAVLVDDAFEVQSFHGEVGEFLQFRRGSLSSSLVPMLRDGFQARVWNALVAARRTGEPTSAAVMLPGETRQHVGLLVEPVPQPDGSRAFLVYFGRRDDPQPDSQVGPVEAERQLVEAYEAEIAALRRELQGVMERSETSNEELQAANEEVMSANEELQSSNEELETSREELQSLNEELTTINVELEEKVSELETTNDDLANLIRSTDVATLFLDTDFAIRRYSARVGDLIAIRSADVGRPLGDLRMLVDDPDVIDDARHVLETLDTHETEVTGEGYAYLRRITPFRTLSNRIAGVIVIWSDVRRLREASYRMAAQAGRQASIAELSRIALGTGSLDTLLARAAEDVRTHAGADFVGIDVPDAERSVFRMTAGAGWPRGMAGHTESPDDPASYPGLVQRLAQPVATSDFSAPDAAIRPSQLLADTGVASGIALPIGPALQSWGVLGVWRRDTGGFDEERTTYVAAVANLLWLAVSQHESQRLRDGQRRALQDLINGLPVMIAVVNADLRFDMTNRAIEAAGFTIDELRGAPIGDVFGARTAEILGEALAAPDREKVELEAEIAIPGTGPRTFLIHGARRPAGRGADGFFVAAVDIHDRKQWEERTRVVSAELDHRVKNILALVNTIARMTGRNADSIETFRETFGDRIQSLARTHAALAETRWQGIALRQLLDDELEAYRTDGLTNVSLDGPDVHLGSRAAQSFALAFHELTTNAVRHGAMSYGNGRLAVSWDVADGRLDLTWQEDGLSGLTPPEQTSFGSSVIRSAIESQLTGTLEMTFRPSGLFCRISVPESALQEAQPNVGHGETDDPRS
ncbi:chemotaxis protein CheB [Wenxinia marina]|uniref:histidine kinase n=1 Tax=Wenxinia marina DSM 24838 TaxID=1123501 RepID=A0A0D0NKL9_9RHOB|nr:chemotaxis protein CheB [Wenxinia marina]KIQ68865.1 Methylase of chemotaxis methyl-accepting protein [Wenxinia marina DSM 24838]GGL64596.1 hypothetical protein GCM10011392_19070 [Wenxinia marina]